MNTSKILKAYVIDGTYNVTEPITQGDYGYILQIEGVELSNTYRVDFANDRHCGEALSVYGDSNGVEVPEELIATGKNIYAFYFYLEEGFGKTTYTWKIPNDTRAKTGDREPTPTQQSAIDQAIAALNSAVTQTGQDVISADESASAAAQSATDAQKAATQAQGSATNASASATTASTEAATATTKASEAATSAANAASAKTAAETAKNGAEDAADRAELAAASIVPVDPTLTIAGRAADAKSTGDRLDALTETVGGKQNTLTFDDVPTSGSANPVKSGGVFEAVDTKVSKPLTNPMGTNGQLLRTLGNGQTEWVDQGLPTDEQTAQAVSDWLDDHPEATTTVQDGAITLPKFNDNLRDTVVIIEQSTKAFFHNVSPISVESYPNTLAGDIPVRYVGSKDYCYDMSRRTGTEGTVVKTRVGRYLTLVGNSTTAITVLNTYNSDLPLLNALAGKTVNLCMYVKKASAWGNSSFVYLRANGSGYLVKKYYTKDSFDLVGWTVVQNIQMPDTLTSLMLKFDSTSGSSFAEGDFVWFGLFEATPVVTETVVDTDPEVIDISGENLTYIDTMLHESVITHAVSTKTYVDNHVPDIKAYWTDNIYALPEHFGAVGDGVEDDTQALVDCIAYSATSGKPVRGYGKYKITSTLVIDTRYSDVYLHEINYTGNASAVEFQNTDIVFGFHRILSNNIGLSFYRSSRNAMRCQIKGNEISSIGHCIDIKNNTYYNTCDIRYLSSENGNCINRNYESLEGPGGEYVFRSSSCRCPNGWVTYNLSESKLYNFTIEGDCKYGLLNPSGCVCIGFRHREQVDGMKLRIWGNTSYNNGPLIKFTEFGSAAGMFRYYTVDGLPYFSIDMSEVQGYGRIPSGEGSTGEWQRLAYTGMDLGFCVRGADAESRHILGDKAYIIGGNLVLAPEGRKTAVIDTATVDFSILESAVDADILTANTIAKYLGTDFLLNIAHADIYLNASFGAIGYNDFTLTQANGNTATIYDKLGNVLFDGTNEGDGKWRFRCVIDRSSWGRYDYNTSWWEYDGTNEFWEIEKIG